MNNIITGASRGIGLAEAKLFDRTGNQLSLVATTKNSFKDTTFTNARLIEADLSTADGIAKVVSEVKAQTDHIDVLITAFANVLRSELAGRIRVSTVHAWGVNTWEEKEPNDLMKPGDIAEVVEFIISRPDSMLVESVDLGHPLG